MVRIECSSGDGPGTHALVVGVSRYAHVSGGEAPTALGESFDIESLSAAARSASEFAGWLMRFYYRRGAPLRSIHIALSPSDGEQLDPDVFAELPDDATTYAATRANVQQAFASFRRESGSDAENVAFVYVVGHGVQLSKHGAIVLLEDFGAESHLNELEGAIDMSGCHAGMNHGGAAGSQFWFVDACRQLPAVARRFETMEGALTLSERQGSVVAHTSPLLLASSPRERAYAEVGKTSLFNQALLWALGGGAINSPDEHCDSWYVSVSNLVSKVDRRVSALAGRRADQNVDPSGRVKDAVVHQFKSAPQVDLSVGLLPPDASGVARIELKANGRDLVAPRGDTWPRVWTVDAGLYLLTVDVEHPYTGWQDILDLEPPEHRVDAEVDK